MKDTGESGQDQEISPVSFEHCLCSSTMLKENTHRLLDQTDILGDLVEQNLCVSVVDLVPRGNGASAARQRHDHSEMSSV